MEGLTSRWTSPFSWATSSAAAICAAIRAARPGSRGPSPQDQRAELGALDPPRDDVDRSVLLARLVQRDDVGVVERGHRPRLAAQSLPDHGVARDLGLDQLERDGPVEPQLAGAVEDPIPPAPTTLSTSYPAKVEPGESISLEVALGDQAKGLRKHAAIIYGEARGVETEPRSTRRRGSRRGLPAVRCGCRRRRVVLQGRWPASSCG